MRFILGSPIFGNRRSCDFGLRTWARQAPQVLAGQSLKPLGLRSSEELGLDRPGTNQPSFSPKSPSSNICGPLHKESVLLGAAGLVKILLGVPRL